MKKLLVIIILCYNLAFSLSLLAGDEKVLIIVDPTLSKLKDISTLVENKYLDVPNLRIIGLYNVHQKINIEESKDFIKNNKLSYIELKGLDLNINPDSLFCKNSCTEKFYDLFQHSDGIIFNGGPDIPPSLYHEKTRLITGVESYGRLYEISFLYHLTAAKEPFLDKKPGYLVFCICLGMQNLNVAMGGTLYQDIPGEIYHIDNCEDVLKLPVHEQHSNYASDLVCKDEVTSYIFHPVLITAGSFLESTAKEADILRPEVMSSHHQCIKGLATGLQVVAVSIDTKVIEAVQNVKFRNVLGVQFHPENRFQYDNTKKVFTCGANPVTAEEVAGKASIVFNRNIWKDLSKRLISR
ncbi:MAG: gamma-glutamyl-gamma-aminobutyrate hydrolase family protein [Bacteroidia bacterium]|nr:gamma-glutamyl-gamma-aminobutyrate hydrolase family protein [Bacteroidia bacterium]